MINGIQTRQGYVRRRFSHSQRAGGRAFKFGVGGRGDHGVVACGSWRLKAAIVGDPDRQAGGNGFHHDGMGLSVIGLLQF